MTKVISASEPLLRLAGFGFLFWVAFLLALEPGLMARAAAMGRPLALDQEAVRIFSAGVLGGFSAAVQFVLVRRFPVAGRRAQAHLAVQTVACLGLSLVMIVIAYAGAPVVLAPDNPRLAVPLGEQIAGNLLLLAFGLAVSALLLNLWRQRRDMTVAPPPVQQPAGRIAVQTRGGIMLVEADTVDWIEAQGNYAALHVGGDVYLVRETLTRLMQRLDAERFVRIHRGAVVNVGRVRRMRPLAAGDALVELADGTELRASRTFAGALRGRVWP